jgi:hypothetical protein
VTDFHEIWYEYYAVQATFFFVLFNIMRYKHAFSIKQLYYGYIVHDSKAREICFNLKRILRLVSVITIIKVK